MLPGEAQPASSSTQGRGGHLPAQVRLRPMSDDEYRSWYDWVVDDYAAGHAATGNITKEAARAMADKEFRQLLPAGVGSLAQHLYTVADAASGAAVGVIWFAERTDGGVPHAFIYNIVVWESHRGKGYGSAAMLAIEPEVRALGLSRIALHVFGSNASAIHVYERTGYSATNILMAKELA